jgi:ethanolaminephosphotransferase
MCGTTSLDTATDQMPKPDAICHDICQIWLLEPPLTNNNDVDSSAAAPSPAVLSEQGLDQIAHHKYKPGTYTALDSFLNPLWQSLTELLPMWLAPNAVTALGGSLCLISYLLTAQYSFSMDASVPNYILILNGICLMAYYTLDCMDGKQARRTGSSSPLGQLFDHGVDCLGNLSHLSLMQSLLQLEPRHYLWLQTSLQLGFFQAQWEEYYTGILQHSSGNIGVTEVLYSMALWSILTGMGIFDREIYSDELPSKLQEWVLKVPGASVVLGDDYVGSYDSVKPLLLRHLIILGWVLGYSLLALSSILRVASHVRSVSRLSVAVSKLVSPLFLCASALYMVHPITVSEVDANGKNSIIAVDVLDCFGGVRYPSLAFGLAFCSITIKLIVFGMAKMRYASIQLDILPLGLLVVFYRDIMIHLSSRGDPVIPSFHGDFRTIDLLFPMAAVLYFMRLVWWTQTAIHQLCQKMGIPLFRIPCASDINDKTE